MKKFLTTALTTTIVVGASVTTFAASNSFSDVPRGHWAYQSVAKLATDGVIEGYGDGTYRGDRLITRYEMAQMIAKALARTDKNHAVKADLDRLAAEFRDELDALGVRVSELEKYSDKVVWHGELRYTYTSQRNEQTDGSKSKATNNLLLFRFEPKAEINEHWTVNARLDATANTKTDKSNDVTLKRAWAQGDYKNFTVKVGKMASGVRYDKDMIFSFAQFSGAELNLGKKLFTAQLRAGRISWGDTKFSTNLRHNGDGAANYQSVALIYALSKLNLAAAYYRLTADWFRNSSSGLYSDETNPDKANIWEIAGGYRFDKNTAISAAYARNAEADYFKHSHMIQFDYKRAKRTQKGSWGAYAAYRYLGANTSIDPCVDGALNNTKGWEVGVAYIPLKNIQLRAIYFNGEQLANGRDAEKFFGRVQWFF